MVHIKSQKPFFYRTSNPKTPITFIYTPMHGVGLPFVREAFSKAFGFPRDSLIPVPQQAQPDPLFPSVKFPNPEEKGALDLAMGLGEEIYSQDLSKTVVLLANDPDADRFGAAEWNGSVRSTYAFLVEVLLCGIGYC